mmetsp:Transcript_21470/g.65608  ORF Transcript_21470/g.65608 Transcript_21470/m.65608 type:complete len:122 (-) Transcript_21470:393-758(-)
MSGTMWGDAFGHQDWGVQTTGTKRSAPTASQRKANTQSAARAGTLRAEVKHTAGRTSINASSGSRNDRSMSKLENDDGEDLKVVRVSGSVARNIQQARTAKGWTQKELGMRISEKAAVIGT